MGQLSVLCVTVVKEVEHLTDSGSSSVRPIPQASVVPYRQLGDATEVCLITSRRKKRWIFPKGTALERTGLIESALKAAMEEAGLIGQVTGETLGCYKRLKEGSAERGERLPDRKWSARRQPGRTKACANVDGCHSPRRGSCS